MFVVLRCRQVRAVGEKELLPCGHLGGGFLLLLDRLLALLLVELLLAFLVFLVPDLIELTAPDLLAIILVTLVGINRLKVRIGIPPLEDLGNLDDVESVDFFLLLRRKSG